MAEKGMKIDRQCIWMKAGVINYKLCPHHYGCHVCAFDKALRNDGVKMHGARYKISWQDKLRRLAGPDRLCRHMIQGMVTYKLCPNDYNCGTCEYDQMVQDRLGGTEMPELRKISGFRIAPNFHFHNRHAWVNVEYNGKCRVGLDDFATQVFGRDRELVLPKVGQDVKQDEPFMKVRCAGKEFDIEAPLDGRISIVNPLYRLSAKDLDPYADGWVAFIEPGSRMLPNLRKLNYGEKALEWLSDSSDKLFEMLTPGRKTAVDGGLIAPEIFASMEPARRIELIETLVLGG